MHYLLDDPVPSHAEAWINAGIRWGWSDRPAYSDLFKKALQFTLF